MIPGAALWGALLREPEKQPFCKGEFAMRKNKTESFRGAFAGGPEGRRKAPDSLPRPVVVVMGGPSARERLELL